MTYRKTSLKTIWQRAKIRPVLLLFAFQGITFSFLLFLPMALILSHMGDDLPFIENVEEIKSNGTETEAKLISIRPVTNIEVQGNNPHVLTYVFDRAGTKKEAGYTTLEPDKILVLKVGDIIPIKYLGEHSVPVALAQYEFEMDFLYYFAIGVLLIGVVLCYILYKRISQEITLYKTGVLREAKIVSISPNSSFTGFSRRVSSMDVYYEYDQIVAKSRTNNLAMINNKSIGDAIKILVSQDGSKSCLYPELIAKTHGWKENYYA